MRSPAEKLRWILLGGSVLLACVLAAIFGMANYRAGQIWRRILARNGVNLKQETNGFTYSQSDGKRTIFTLHAAKAKPQGGGKWSLSDAVLVLYTKDGRTDRIYGSQFDYDQEAGVARAVGEVHMDLQAPIPSSQTVQGQPAIGLGFTPGDSAAQNGTLIHVRTSGLVYRRKLGVAATPEMTEFRYRGLTCKSHGAEFDSGADLLRLLADVQLDGVLRGSPFHLTAAHANLDRNASTTDLLHPVFDSEDRRSSADHALLHLRAGGSLLSADADGHVQLQSDTQTVNAPRAHGDFDRNNRPQHALLSGGVRYADTAAAQPSRGEANTLELQFTEAGQLRSANAEGGVDFNSRSGLNSADSRQMHSRRAVASFLPGPPDSRRSLLRSLQMTGSAALLGATAAKVPGETPALTRVEADDLTTIFTAAGQKSQPTLLTGNGHTLLEQRGGRGQHQVSTADSLEMHFAEPAGIPNAKASEPMEVRSATQIGHVVLHSWSSKVTESPSAHPLPSTGTELQGGSLTVAHAEKAAYEAVESTLRLTGGGAAKADLFDGTTQITAPTIVLHQETGDGEASGGVIATTGGVGGTETTHVLASRAALLHRAGVSQFFGTDAQPALLWQGASQVRAATLSLDEPTHRFSARPESKGGSIHAVFANARPSTGAASVGKTKSGVASSGIGPLGGSSPPASHDALEIQAATMDYSHGNREATFGGGVRLRGSEGDITGEHGAAFLAPAANEAKTEQRPSSLSSDFGGKLERFVVLGDVHMAQPGRTGTGGQLTYTASSNNFVLTGSGATLPRIRDAQQGLVTGPTLVYGAADSSIVVAENFAIKGTATAKSAKPARVHTETDLKQP